MIIRAIFTGASARGYETGKEYKIKLFEKMDGVSIQNLDGTGNCSYESLSAFLSNWDKIEGLDAINDVRVQKKVRDEFTFLATTNYACDRKLFEEIGLATFHSTSNEEIELGEYKLPDYFEKAIVKVFVTCMPAQFWRFVVETDDDKTFEISTGSGTLSQYWPSVLLVANGCFAVKQIEAESE